MPDFIALSDEQVVDYLLQNFADLGSGEPMPRMKEEILRGIEIGHVIIEKQEGAFAIVAKANRKYDGEVGLLIRIPPQAELMILFVTPEARGNGIGREMLEQVKDRYMEDQSMELVCAGEKRRTFFERAGFVAQSLTVQGLHHMFCPPKMCQADTGQQPE